MNDATLPSVPRRWQGAVQAVRHDFGPLLAFDVVFRGLSALALAPAVAWAVALLVEGTGASAVGNADILAFVLSPRGLATLVAGATLLLALQLIETAGFLHLLARERAGLPHHLGTSLAAAFRAIPRALRLSLALTVRLLAVAVPFLAALGGVFLVFLTEHDINFYLHDKPPELWKAVGLGVVVLLAGAWTLGRLWVRWSLALPIALQEGLAARAALAESTRRTEGARGRLALALLGWIVLAALVTGALLLAFDVAGAAILGSVPERTAVVLPVLALLLLGHVLLAAVTAFLTSAGHAALLLDLYAERGGASAARVEGVEAPAARTRSLLATTAVLALLLVGAGVAGTIAVRRARAERSVGVQAHRGASRAAPENTASAVRLAIEAGADWAEIDVQRTKDGIVVLGHDADLQRAAGVPLKIADSTYAELQTADVGRRFSEKFAGERVATLADVMDLSRDKIRLNIELKFYGKDRRLVEDVVRLVREKDFETSCVIASLDVPAVLEAHRLDPRLRTAAIVSMAVGNLTSLDVDILSLRTDLATDALIRTAHRRGKEVWVWTVDDPRAMSDWIDRGVDGILTNEPETLVRTMKERTDLSDAQRLLLVGRSLFR